MVHISELSYTAGFIRPRDRQPRRRVNVVVKAVARKKSASPSGLRDAEGDPWARSRALHRRPARGRGPRKKKSSAILSAWPGHHRSAPDGEHPPVFGRAPLKKPGRAKHSAWRRGNQAPSAPDFARPGQLRGRGRLARFTQQPGFVPRLWPKSCRGDDLAKKIV